jgi:hypothetical protein
MMYLLSAHKGRHFRRKRRRGRMTPAIADRISSRTRETRWPVTKSITRYHRYPRHWYFKHDWTWSDWT